MIATRPVLPIAPSKLPPALWLALGTGAMGSWDGDGFGRNTSLTRQPSALPVGGMPRAHDAAKSARVMSEQCIDCEGRQRPPPLDFFELCAPLYRYVPLLLSEPCAAPIICRKHAPP